MMSRSRNNLTDAGPVSSDNDDATTSAASVEPASPQTYMTEQCTGASIHNEQSLHEKLEKLEIDSNSENDKPKKLRRSWSADNLPSLCDDVDLDLKKLTIPERVSTSKTKKQFDTAAGSWEMFGVDVENVEKSQTFIGLIEEAARECGLPDMPERASAYTHLLEHLTLMIHTAYRASQDALIQYQEEQLIDDSSASDPSCLIQEGESSEDVYYKHCWRETSSFNNWYQYAHKYTRGIPRHVSKAFMKQEVATAGVTAATDATFSTISAYVMQSISMFMKTLWSPSHLGNGVSKTTTFVTPESTQAVLRYSQALHALCLPFSYAWRDVEHEAILHPLTAEGVKTRATCRPDVQMWAQAYTQDPNTKCLKTLDYFNMLVAEVKPTPSKETFENGDCEAVKYCGRTLNQHFLQLLVCIRGSLFANDWRLAAGKAHFRLRPSKHNYIFGVMMHGLNLQFTCLKMSDDHMGKVVEQTKPVQLAGDEKTPETRSDDREKLVTICNDSRLLDKCKGTLFVSKNPYNLENPTDLSEVLAVLATLGKYKNIDMIDLLK